MLKIKISEIFRHRNETTFRPYIMAKHLFRDIGIQFVFEGNDYDLTWVGQASYVDRCRAYDLSVNRGIKFLDKECGNSDHVLFDGQDSASLMGTWDVFKQSKAKLLLKNTLYKNRELYKKPSVYGRAYWGSDPAFDYSIQDEIPWDKVKLTGCNWLSTVHHHIYDWKSFKKDIDVCAMFAYPAKENIEFDRLTNQFYDKHRERCINELRQLPKNIKVAMLDKGKKVPIDEYYDIMMRSKIIIAPFGYGEIAPRDIESCLLGAILIKPSMEHIETIPNVYNQTTFVDCSWDYADVREKIESILSDFSAKQEQYVNDMKKAYVSEYDLEKLVLHTHNWISNLDGFGTD